MKERKLAKAWVLVEVPEPFLLFDKSSAARERRMMRDAREIMEGIRRHVDDVGHMHVQSEYEESCEHCGWAWDQPADSLHNGGCCDADCAVYTLTGDSDYRVTTEDLADDYWRYADIRCGAVLSALAAVNVMHRDFVEQDCAA